ncbi:MAG: class C sortase [Lachnospiraceae bacterium]|nr:class C sortase [Lachnospiraceae bacterium]
MIHFFPKKAAPLLLFLAGLALLLYPVTGNLWNTMRQKSLANTYEAQVSELTEEGYEEEWAAARAYNAAHTPIWVPDAFAAGQEAVDEEYENALNVAGNGIMGYLEIPKIDIRIPVYHGTEDDVLTKGAGHLQGSSLPVGGETSHAVIAAHRGLPSAPLFTDLDLLEEGDLFYLYILDEILAYEVEEILVVEPEETESLTPVTGQDLVTLVTCTPYGVNTQRLLVRGHRVEYVEEQYVEEAARATTSMATNYGLVAFLGLLTVAAAALLIRWYYHRKAQAA